jgi:UMF1 family MFS transporter
LKLDLPGVEPAALETMERSLAASLEDFAQSQQTELKDYRHAISRSTLLFWSMAILVGTVQGGIQAVSRSYFGKLVPKNRSNEYFGFFDIFGKFATFVGPLLYALVGSVTGRSSYGTLTLLFLFLAGFIILWRAKEPLEQLERERAADQAV